MKIFTRVLHEIIPHERLSPVYLGMALIISFWVYFAEQKPRSLSSRGFLRFCFPQNIYSNSSAVLDFIYYGVYQALSWLLIAPILLNPSAAAAFFGKLFNQSLPSPAGLNLSAPLLTAAFTLTNILAIDFGNFITHYYQHKIPWLWEFHKIHHSAAVLTPVTVYRIHPVDNLLTMSFTGLLTGFNLALFDHFFHGRFSEIRVLNLNLFVFLFYFLGFNLRHSHIWLNYPGFFSKVFISPAQHQIHHSKASAHQDKNFGFLFSFWDSLFGSLFIPREKMEIQFGLSGNEELEYSSLPRLFFLPFTKIIRRRQPEGAHS